MSTPIFKNLVLLILLVTALPLAPVLAQEPIDETDQELPASANDDDAIDLAPGINVDAANTFTSNIAEGDIPFISLGYPIQTVTELRSRTFALDLPSNLVLNSEGHFVELVIAHFPPIPDRASTMNVAFNEVPVAVIPLDEGNAQPTLYRFDLRTDSFKPGRNRLTVSVSSGGTCNTEGSRVDLLVFSNSRFHLNYEQVQYTPDLSRYPVPFFENSFLSNELYFVLPEQFTAADLSAMATIAAGLGKYSEGSLPLRAVSTSQLTPEIRDQHHLIVIGTQGTNRLLTELPLPLEVSQTSVSETQGVIQELVSPWNPFKMVLAVSGLTEEGMIKASQALNRDSHFLGMRGAVAIVESVDPAPEAPSEPPNVDITLASLGYETETIFGLAPADVPYRFSMPLSWAMVEEPEFVLSFQHSELINPEASTLIVFLNRVPLGGVLLDADNAQDGVLRVRIPSWQLRPGQNEIKISVEMNLRGNQDKCLHLTDQQAWVTLSSESYLHLPLKPQEVEPHLGLFPYPFTQSPDLDEVILVLPDQPQEQDLTALVRLAAMLGEATRGDFLAVEAMTSADLSDVQQHDKHFIILGQPADNVLLQAINEWLPLPFEDDLTRLRPGIDTVIFVQEADRSAGLLQELALPWNPDRTALVVTGTNREGLALAYETLFTRTSDLAGNVAVTESFTDTVYTYDTRTARSTPANSAPAVERFGLDPNHLVQLGERYW